MQRLLAVLVLGLVLASTCAPATASTLASQFQEFTVKYGKTYAAEEYSARVQIFRENLARIDKLNAAQSSAKYGVTKFADLTPQEFKDLYLNDMVAKPQPAARDVALAKLNVNAPIPAQFDWRDKGAVTPAKDQGQCGSCWAFSVTEAIESQWFLSGRNLPVLSPQQIVDCDKGNGNYGCNGGYPTTAYEYVIKAGGLDTEAAYPYYAFDGSCKFKPADVGAKISNWTYITQTKNETAIQVAVATKAPLSICVDAESWQFYEGGVITSLCGTTLDHCVMLTGYSVQRGWDLFNYDVWNIRNSWGDDWGYGGYLYVQRGSNICGVAELATLPIV